jgi:spore germination protein GerM
VRPRLLAVACAFSIAWLPACGRKDETQPETVAASPQDQAAPTQPQPDAPQSEQAEPLAKATVTLYFPSAGGDLLTAETREIVDTKRPADRGAQIVAALLEGPKSEGALPAVPPGTTLRQLWVRDDGNAYADFSEELMTGANAGSADEILTVYAIVDSLTQNVSEIRKVGILVAGRERETFGHLDLSHPIPPDLTWAKPK